MTLLVVLAAGGCNEHPLKAVELPTRIVPTVCDEELPPLPEPTVRLEPAPGETSLCLEDLGSTVLGGDGPIDGRITAGTLPGRGSILLAGGNALSALSWMEWDGAGGLTARQENLGEQVFAHRLEDANDDGRVDLLLAFDDRVSVQPGLGDGTFGPAAEYPVDARPGDVMAADHDGDGHSDIVVTSRYHSGTRVQVFPGGPGEADPFTEKVEVFIADGGRLPDLPGAAADVTGDGFMDYIVESSYGAPLLLASDGELGFERGVYLSNDPVGFFELHDLGEGDGNPDLVCAGAAGVLVSPGTDDGFGSDRGVASPSMFGAATAGQVQSFRAHAAFAVGDLDDDHRVDLVTFVGDQARLCGRTVNAWSLEVHRGRADGGFHPPARLVLETTYSLFPQADVEAVPRWGEGGGLALSPLSLLVTDVDGDHRNDLVLSSPSGMLDRDPEATVRIVKGCAQRPPVAHPDDLVADAG